VTSNLPVKRPDNGDGLLSLIAAVGPAANYTCGGRIRPAYKVVHTVTGKLEKVSVPVVKAARESLMIGTN
jgi:hypothetical protein